MARGVIIRNCRGPCGQEFPREELSVRGKCSDCADLLIAENIRQLHYHRGPHFDHWLMRIRASLGVVAMDNPGSIPYNEPIDTNQRGR